MDGRVVYDSDRATRTGLSGAGMKNCCRGGVHNKWSDVVVVG